MKKFRILKNWKRLFILGFTLIATILVVVFGSVFYVSKNVKKGIEYGGGEEYVVSINANGKDSSKIATDVAQSIYERVDALGVKGVQVDPEFQGKKASIRVSYPGLTTSKEIDEIKTLITSKPHLIFTDVMGNVLFNKNRQFVNPKVSPTPKDDALYIQKIKSSSVPISGAKSIFSSGSSKVEIKLTSSGQAEWTKATQYIAHLAKGQNKILVWLDLEKLVKMATTDKRFVNEWNTTAKRQPYLFIRYQSSLKNVLKKNIFDAKKYLLSDASVKTALSGKSFVIEGSFTKEETLALARKISYGISNYSLNIISAHHVGASYGNDAFHKAMIAGLIVFAIIALFLIANYGILGVLSSISIALYMFLTLAVFTVMKGEYSPETIAALIIGIGMSVDANIITFERLKANVYSGYSIKKSNTQANKQSFSTIFDANITTLIVAFVLFFFGTRNIVGLSIMLILSIFFTLILMLVFTRIISSLLINTGWFDKRKHLLGMHKNFDKKTQEVFNKVDYVKSSKWFAIGSGVLISIGVTVFSIFAGISGSMSKGFVLSQEFSGGSVVEVSSDRINGVFKSNINEDDEAKNLLIKAGAHTSEIETIYLSGHAKDKKFIKSFKLRTTRDINVTKINNEIKNNHPYFKLYSSVTTNDVAKQILKNAMIAILIAMALIVLYTLIRFKWTFSFSAIVALIHDGLIVTAVFIIARVEISPVFIAGILSIIGYSINDTIVTFDRIRENMEHNTSKLTNEKIKEIANRSVRETIKRSVLTSFTTLIAIVVLMSFGNATKFGFNLAMLIGIVAGTYSSIFIATALWVRLEIYRQRRITAREKNNFWKTKGVEEQTFNGINEFKS